MASSSWSSTPWVPAGAAWHKHRVPYKSGGTYLHTVDVWGPWIVYIHGGAWRDPLVDSSSFENTATKLLSAHDCKIAGIASVNYPLSSHPNHPTHPAPPKDPSLPVDEARTAKHPEHIIAVLSALAYLQNEVGAAHNYILSGHSCGATLAFQVVMNPERWAAAVPGAVAIPKIRKPEIIVGLNGLYDLKYFIDSPPASHEKLLSVYVDFTRGAFGEDETVWKAVCPTAVSDWSAEWPEGKVVVVVQSLEDGLVPYSQTELMKEHLAKCSALKVVEMGAGGDHNDLWKVGDELAGIMTKVVAEFT
ncbi:hypothetical protein NLU13_5179 [Sarocladium strictum]|uniref:Kynurenine formamidase n=1 Tax=Sarocladium strictum TaxID=5046 RepID=A0AA39L6Y9_SARSR|nr:hypothetical protein NLU13_5179 [Sarocladium strictum]